MVGVGSVQSGTETNKDLELLGRQTVLTTRVMIGGTTSSTVVVTGTESGNGGLGSTGSSGSAPATS